MCKSLFYIQFNIISDIDVGLDIYIFIFFKTVIRVINFIIKIFNLCSNVHFLHVNVSDKNLLNQC